MGHSQSDDHVDHTAMKSRLTDIPILKAIPTYIEAAYYNRIRIALKRLDSPVRIELINLRGLDIIIDEEAWVCVDRTMNDLPILAWTDFEIRHRTSLSESIGCQLRFFHSHADLICGSVLGIAQRQIEERLSVLREHRTEPCEIRYIRSFR